MFVTCAKMLLNSNFASHIDPYCVRQLNEYRRKVLYYLHNVHDCGIIFYVMLLHDKHVNFFLRLHHDVEDTVFTVVSVLFYL
jgi:hypothetical protein